MMIKEKEMKKSYILLLLIILSFGLMPVRAENIADEWIKDQVALQYSEKTSAPGRILADFSPFSMELDIFERDKEAVYDLMLYGRDAHDIIELYRMGVYEGEFSWKNPFPCGSSSFSAPFSQKATVRDITLYYLVKMRRSQEMGMNIILSVNPDALEEAEYWDNRREEAGNLPLFGLPVAVKANIGTADRQPTSAGAIALQNSLCIRDAFIIKRIKESGGIILAKTNLSEWANFMSENSANGFSALGGQTRNPYGRFDVGGSSSGSAAAVAMGLVPLALGTETSGSIVYPASQNSVVGLKPSLGLVSRDCIIPIAEAQDTAGPITVSVRDAGLLLSVIAGFDGADPATALCSDKKEDYNLERLHEKPLKGLRFGLVSSSLMRRYYYRAEEARIQMRIAGELSRAGAVVVFVEMDEAVYSRLDVLSVFHYQFREGVNRYLEKCSRGGSCRSVAEIIRFNSQKPGERMPLGQELLIASENNASAEDEIEMLAFSNRRESRQVIDSLLKDNELDILFSLSNHLSYIYASAGYPALCVPAGYKSNGEPVGVTFTCSLGDERLLISAGWGYEQATGHRKKAEPYSY